ncbi:MAG: hypothetical protein ACKVGW_17405, partial [Verrucomicrobiia bacterium]
IYPGDATGLADPSTDVAYRWVRQGNYKLIIPSSEEAWGNYLDTVGLFDLSVDPEETKNLASDPQYQSIKAALRAMLDNWWTP